MQFFRVLTVPDIFDLVRDNNRHFEQPQPLTRLRLEKGSSVLEIPVDQFEQRLVDLEMLKQGFLGNAQVKKDNPIGYFGMMVFVESLQLLIEKARLFNQVVQG